MSKKLVILLPFIFLLSVWFSFAYPYFLQGKVPYPSTYQVNHFHPWSLDQKYWGPVKNGAMPDVIDQIYPWRHFSMQEWKAGRVPFWNPNSFAGNPHLANVQSAALSPLNFLFFILPFLDAWSIIVLFQSLIAGFGLYALFRSYRVSKEGAILGSISFMFCGFMVTWMAYATLALAVSFLPFTIFSIHKLIETGKKRWGLLLTVCIASSFFSGHFQTSLYLLLLSFGYLIHSSIVEKQKKRSFLALFFLLVGLLISLIQILPAVQFYGLSVRSSIFIQSGGIPFHYLIALFAPDFFGNPVTGNTWFGNYAEWASFVGVVPLVFALFSLNIWRQKYVQFFIIAVIVSLLFALESPVLSLLGLLHIPVLSTSTPSRLIVVFSFSLTILAGFGYDYWRNHSGKIFSRRLVVPLLGIGIFFIILWSLLFFSSVFPKEVLSVARKNLVLPTVFLGAIIAIVFVKKYAVKNRIALSIIIFLPVLLTIFDSVRFASKWMPFDPKTLVFADAPVISAMQKEIGNGRVFGNFGAQVSTYYNLPIIEGYDPLYIDRYGEFIRSSSTGEYVSSERSVVRIDRNGKYTKRVLNLLGVGIIYQPIADTNQSWAFPVWEEKTYERVYKDDLFELYKNPDAIKRPSLFYSYEVVTNPRRLLKRFYAEEFDYKKTLLLEENPGMNLKDISDPQGKVQVLEETPDSLTVEVMTNSPALLFLSDNYYPGWKATVNKKETKVFRADYTFRAIVLSRGKSLVEFFYSGLP